MASGDDLQSLVLKGVTPLNRDELGRGAYGRVYAVNYHGTICAAKEIHSILVEGVGQVQMQRTIESFMRECRQCSTLRHPNVIQFLGVYYPSVAGAGVRVRLPVMVMEMMADSLTSLVDKHEKIPVRIKYSIVHDVSLGLCYLHNHDPPIVHRDLSPNNILLMAHHVAKISDLGVAKVIKADSRKTMTQAPGTVDFMPPESLANTPVYGPPMDVFSLAGIILHTFNQQWPHPTDQVQFDPKTRKMVAFSEVERRQQYLDKLRGELKPLVEECLDNDPAVRPTIGAVCERVQVNKDVYIKESPQDVITLHQQVEQKDRENAELKSEVEQLRQQLSSSRSVSTQQVAGQLNRISLGEEGSTTEPSKLITEAPPLMSTLTSDRYHMKWTQLANLPAPMYDPYVTVQDKKIYITSDAPHQVYIYDVNTDHWNQSPPSGHYKGVPHIIGGKLAIIGGRLSATKKMTNKVSTFDKNSQSWTSYYPDLLSVRSKPGVVTHLEHVIVAGGGNLGNDIQDDIEILNWVENAHWTKVSIKLPMPMYGFAPIIADDHYVIVGYSSAGMRVYNNAYTIPVNDITRSGDQQQTSATPTKWVKMTSATHWHTALVPSSSPPVVVGGLDTSGTILTSDIKMYDDSNKSWRKIASLPSARSNVAIATINNNAIIVIGGCTKGDSVDNAMSSSLTTVELGQTQLIH